MARKTKNISRNPYIIVFWEGESEEAYFKFMRQEFHDKANVKVHSKKGIFTMAKKAFSPKGDYGEEAAYVDEVWFVFDTEPDLRQKWDEYWDIVKGIRKKCKNARVRLLMTKGCIEYFFLLHYEKSASTITMPADKEKVLRNLKSKHCPDYEKGNKNATWKIAENYMIGIENGNWSLKRIEDELSKAKNEDERYKILYFTDSTFTNAHEAIEYLKAL
jgi:hypothetical protein